MSTPTLEPPLRRPIAPLGQLYDAPPPADVQHFRAAGGRLRLHRSELVVLAVGQRRGLGGDRTPDPAPAMLTPPAYPVLKTGAKGDVVVWAQEHLMTAGQPVSASGTFDAATAQAVSAFQAAHGDRPERSDRPAHLDRAAEARSRAGGVDQQGPRRRRVRQAQRPPLGAPARQALRDPARAADGLGL